MPCIPSATKPKRQTFQKQINGLFIAISILNIVWLFLWQNELQPISAAIIVTFLVALMAIYLRLNIGKANVSLKEKLCVRYCLVFILDG